MTPFYYAQLAERAYTDPPTVGDEDSAARAVITGNVVAFPGSNNVACWLADLDTEIVFCELGSVHHGFWRALNEILAPLLAKPGQEIVVGHSEGGALALLYAGALCRRSRPPKAVYAFEPPRVSVDNTLGQLLDRHGVALNLYRNGEDVVPLVPRILRSWQHPGDLIHIGDATWPFPNVEDHAISRVMAALAK